MELEPGTAQNPFNLFDTSNIVVNPQLIHNLQKWIDKSKKLSCKLERVLEIDVVDNPEQFETYRRNPEAYPGRVIVQQNTTLANGLEIYAYEITTNTYLYGRLYQVRNVYPSITYDRIVYVVSTIYQIGTDGWKSAYHNYDITGYPTWVEDNEIDFNITLPRVPYELRANEHNSFSFKGYRTQPYQFIFYKCPTNILNLNDISRDFVSSISDLFTKHGGDIIYVGSNVIGFAPVSTISKELEQHMTTLPIEGDPEHIGLLGSEYRAARERFYAENARDTSRPIAQLSAAAPPSSRGGSRRHRRRKYTHPRRRTRRRDVPN